MAEEHKYPWMLSGFLLLIYLSTAKYTNSIPVFPGIYPLTLADAVLAPRFLSTAAGSLIFILFLVLKKRKNNSLPFSLIILLYGIIVLSYFVFIPAAVNPSEALYKAVFELQFFILLITVIVYLKRFTSPLLSIARALLPVCIIHVSVLCVQLGYIIPREGLPDHAASYRLTALMSHRNLAAQLSLLLIPFCFYSLISYRKKLWRMLQIILITLLLGFIILSYSRAVWLAVAAAFSIFVILILARYRFWIRKYKKKVMLAGIASAVAIGLVAILLTQDTSTFKDQLSSLKNPTYGSANERLELWKFTAAEIRDSPLSGHGGGNWKIMAMKHDVSTIRKNAAPGTQVFFQRPHNDYLWKWYEAGLAAFLAFMLLLIFAIHKAIANYFRQQSTHKASGVLVIISLLLIYIILSFFSFPDERPMLKLMFILIIAPAVLIKPSEGKISYSIFYVILALQLLIIPTGYLRLSSSAHNHTMQLARLEGDLSTVISEGRKAENFLATMDDVATPFSWYTGEALYFRGEMTKAEQAYLRAYNANPYHIHVLNNLGVVYLKTGKMHLAEKYFTQALSISPGFDQCRLNYAICLMKLNKLDKSIDQLRSISQEELLENSEEIARKLLPAYTWKTAENTSDDDLKKIILRIERNETWMQKIFEKSRMNKISYHKQLLLDATYVLQQDTAHPDNTK